jgi:acyl carrier protein
MIGSVKEAPREPADIEAYVVEVVARKKKVAPAAVTAASTFAELGIDSLDAADLIFTIEERFEIVVPDEAAQSMRSVGQVVDGIRQLVNARAEAG